MSVALSPLLATWMQLQSEIDAVGAQAQRVLVDHGGAASAAACALVRIASHAHGALETTQGQLRAAMDARDAAQDQRDAAVADVDATKAVLASQASAIASLTVRLEEAEAARDAAVASAMAATSATTDKVATLQAAMAALREGRAPDDRGDSEDGAEPARAARPRSNKAKPRSTPAESAVCIVDAVTEAAAAAPARKPAKGKAKPKSTAKATPAITAARHPPGIDVSVPGVGSKRLRSMASAVAEAVGSPAMAANSGSHDGSIEVTSKRPRRTALVVPDTESPAASGNHDGGDGMGVEPIPTLAASLEGGSGDTDENSAPSDLPLVPPATQARPAADKPRRPRTAGVATAPAHSSAPSLAAAPSTDPAHPASLPAPLPLRSLATANHPSAGGVGSVAAFGGLRLMAMPKLKASALALTSAGGSGSGAPTLR